MPKWPGSWRVPIPATGEARKKWPLKYTKKILLKKCVKIFNVKYILNANWYSLVALFPKYFKVLTTNQFWKFFSKISLIGGESPIPGIAVGDGDLNTLITSIFTVISQNIALRRSLGLSEGGRTTFIHHSKIINYIRHWEAFWPFIVHALLALMSITSMHPQCWHC